MHNLFPDLLTKNEVNRKRNNILLQFLRLKNNFPFFQDKNHLNLFCFSVGLSIFHSLSFVYRKIILLQHQNGLVEGRRSTAVIMGFIFIQFFYFLSM
jgi:hypothetical protein